MSEVATCPGLFYATPAQDGVLSRIRIPGGQLNVPQSEAIADLADQLGGGVVQITNRANVQIRGSEAGISVGRLTRLQTLGLASPVAAVDQIRNVMCSPTAGIDRCQLIDTRPWVDAWNQIVISRPDFAELSAKFSVCWDGGEAVSVGDRPNDICLSAERTDCGRVQFRLRLSVGDRGAAPQDVGVWIDPADCLTVLTALTEVYHDYTVQQRQQSSDDRPCSKPRLRALLSEWGSVTYLQAVDGRLPFSLVRSPQRANLGFSTTYHHLGSHPQRQSGLFYVGVLIPVGRLKTQQLRGLADLADRYGSGSLRLTPWQTVLIADIPQAHVALVQQGLDLLGLSDGATHPGGAIVACSGSTGCKSSATDTQAHALAIAAHLEQHCERDRPINLHLSGCEKSCAQHYPSDIALVGVATAGTARYQLYVGEGESRFGRALYSDCRFESIPNLIEHMIKIYRMHRLGADESFREFANRHEIAHLQHWFDAGKQPD